MFFVVTAHGGWREILLDLIDWQVNALKNSYDRKKRVSSLRTHTYILVFPATATRTKNANLPRRSETDGSVRGWTWISAWDSFRLVLIKRWRWVLLLLITIAESSHKACTGHEAKQPLWGHFLSGERQQNGHAKLRLHFDVASCSLGKFF